MKLSTQALILATKAHDGTYRKSNDKVPYIIHPIRVAEVVAQYTNNDNIIAAAYLHDVVEDTDFAIDAFPKEVQD